MRITEYDFKNFRVYPEWSRAADDFGSLQIQAHRLCNLWQVTSNFVRDTYMFRIERRKGHYTEFHRKVTLPALDIEGIMMLDMDVMLSCIFDPYVEQASHNTIQLYTNEMEDERWLKFLERCPYARKVWSVPSKMSKYNVSEWLISKEDYREVR